jgi:hypothetical protein
MKIRTFFKHLSYSHYSHIAIVTSIALSCCIPTLFQQAYSSPLKSRAKQAQAIVKKTNPDPEELPVGYKGKTRGEFTGIETGDYIHLLVKEKNGREISFWCWTKPIPDIITYDPACDPYVSEKKKYLKKQIVVDWVIGEEMVPQAGAKVKMMKVVSIKTASEK